MAPGGLQHLGRAVIQGGPKDQHREDSSNVLPFLTGGGNAVGGSLRETDDRRGTFLSGEAAGSGTVHGVWGGNCAWFAGSAHADAAWEVSVWETAFRNQGPGWGDTYLHNGLLGRRGTAELPHRGVFGAGGNKDGDAGSFLPPAWPGYRHHFVGGKPPPPTVPPMRHVGALEHTER